jgi:Raf kinase inhibitor-like YbhB/YbcL family protein
MKSIVFLLAAMTIGIFASAQTFTLKSKEIGGQATNRQFFNGFGCHGDNVSPELYWENVPVGTQSFAVTMYDKDAPSGSGWWHWVIFNIPANVHELQSGAGDPAGALAPAGAIQAITDFGTRGYGGCCPTPGLAHEYLITVYALKSKLNLDPTAGAAMVGASMNPKIIARASIVMYAQSR